MAMAALREKPDLETPATAADVGRASRGSRWLAEWLVRLRLPLLVAALVLAALAWTPARHVQFDRSIENMFAADDPLLPPYRLLKQQFGGNEIVMAVYADPHLLAQDGSGISNLADVTQRLRQVPGVKDLNRDTRLPGKVVPDHYAFARRGIESPAIRGHPLYA